MLTRRAFFDAILARAARAAIHRARPNPALLSTAENLVVQPQPYNQHSAPLYWSAYEYCFIHNSAIPESEWKSNIDWVAANLAPYGYKMVSIDGWGGLDTSFDENGY